jgi:chemotaxis protein methyltransferase CheR
MTPDEFDYICRLVRERSAIVLEPGKEYLVEGRLTPVVRELELGSISNLVARLRTVPDNGLVGRVVDAMVTTETSFFRDMLPFEGLKTLILPELIERRHSERQLNIWCAACASGQEPYSLAILIREHFPVLATWNVNILATDISREILARAKAGLFNQIEVNRGLPAPLLVKHFKQRGSAWELSEEIRSKIEFRELNLTRPWPPLRQMDLVLLRNVMIYFDIETKKAILGRVARLLRPDGYLLLGGAETTFNLDDSFRRVERSKAGFYQLVGSGG